MAEQVRVGRDARTTVGRASRRFGRRALHAATLCTIGFLALALSLTSRPAASEPELAIEPREPDQARVDPAPTVRPTATPVATPAPTPAPAPGAPAAPERWVLTGRVTSLRSAPAPAGHEFTDLPTGSYLRVLDERPGWLYVYYPGDGADRQPGSAWIEAGDAEPAEAPHPWLRVERPTTLWSASTGSAQPRLTLPPAGRVEAVGAVEHGRVPVRFPGDGRVPPGHGWVDVGDLAPIPPPARSQLPAGYPATADGAALRIHVPYRSQLDGSLSQAANCGPASAGMLLEAQGRYVPTLELREQMLRLMGVAGHDTGVYIETIARVLERYGRQTADLFDGAGYRRWTLDDARRHLREGHPVVVQVRYRLLPGREDYEAGDDHYVILTGLIGESFLYNDPIDREGPGYDRVLTADQLWRAWSGSSEPFAALAVR